MLPELPVAARACFMRYLTVKKFKDPDGTIPLFVDLRHINKLSNTALLHFIRSSCSSAQNIVTDDQFKRALKAGCISLILDGFDEINYDLRDAVERQILEIRRLYPNISIVISSRPDTERFASWAMFHTFCVDKLSKPQCLQLIEMLPYDSGVKRRFVAEVSSNLYERHMSFLSSPLLTTIMLLTYESFASIPDKMHLFYTQAFDTLVQRHDALKDQFTRKMRSGLSPGDFKGCFAAFCAMSYLEERFSFDEDNLTRIAARAIDYARQNNKDVKASVTPTDFLEDLSSSICMLHRDGVEIAFVHRSFQEYFAAKFVTETHSETRKILDKFSVRFKDSVIPMALEMDREGIEQKWVVPAITSLHEKLYDGSMPLDISKSIQGSYRKSHSIKSMHANFLRLILMPI